MAPCDPIWQLAESFRQQWHDEHIQQCNSSRDSGQKECVKKEDDGYNACTQQADEGYNACTQQADEGYNACSQQADEGYNACCTWAPCSWFCNALVWVSNIVCVAWTWVSNIVCVVWTWVSNIVCVVWTWISHIVCVLWTYIKWVVCRVVSWVINGLIWTVIQLGSLLCPIYTGLLPSYRICGGTTQKVSAVPRVTATAFSVAAVASRFDYRDSGKRYEFQIDGTGAVRFRAAGTNWQTVALQTVSFDNRRLGTRSRAPAFDIVAANCGRVFAKERGSDRFHFALLDPMFWQFTDATNPEAGIDGPRAAARAAEIVVPSTYFKIDPEENVSGENISDLLPPLADPLGTHPPFNGHPAAERFDFFKAVLAAKDGLLGQFFHGMVVKVEPHLWHLMDTRPPRGQARVPSALPAYPQVIYCDKKGKPTPQCSIAFDRVLDIGVGHAHWHEQYDRTFGGEIQALQSKGLSGVLVLTYYQLFNGPVVDGDGFIDGTCNYYLLCRLATPAVNGASGCEPLPPDQGTSPASGQKFALLFADEQSLFSQRWRLTHPDDNDGLKLSFALLYDLHNQPNQWGFDVAKFWCPFKAQFVNEQSRLAVSRQVILVNGTDPGTQRQEIYSINFSCATSDYSWRWRAFPETTATLLLSAADVRSGGETIDPTQADTVYLQTLRLREDMTIHVKGTHRMSYARDQIRVGRWFQKYLPADGQPVPAAQQLSTATDGVTPNKPSTGYSHPWQFLPEDTFQRADTFSHFGVYQQVNSRSQYYTVEVGDEQLTGTTPDSRWQDDSQQLGMTRAKFDWEILSGGGGTAVLDQIATAFPAGPDSLEALVWFLPTHTKQFQSSYNPDRIFLRLANRGPLGWIATHWDKRDDDLDVFDNLPLQVSLMLGGADTAISLQLTLQSQVRVISVPAINQVVVTVQWEKGRVVKAVVSFQSVVASQLLSAGPLDANGENKVWENVWRVMIGVIPAGSPAIAIFDRIAPGNFTLRPGSDGWFDADWAPQDSAEASNIAKYCSERGQAEDGASVWFEDVVGHVSRADLTSFVSTAHSS